MAFKEESFFETVTLQLGESGPEGNFTGTDALTVRWIDSHSDRNNSAGWPNTIETNPYLGRRSEWHQTPVERIGSHHTLSGNTQFVYGELGDYCGLSTNPWSRSICFQTDDLDRVYDGIVNRIINNIRQNNVNYGEAFHTRSDTANMVAKSATKIAKSFLALKRGNLRQAVTELTGDASKLPVKRYAGGIPEQWLALQYGWKPLVQDCYNSLKAVHKAWSDGSKAYTARGSFGVNSGDIQFDFRQATNVPKFRDVYHTRWVRGNGSVTYKISSPTIAALADLGITNPASIAWEILPYSFVVDWFLPIGPYLENLSYEQGLTFLNGWITIKATQSCTRAITDFYAYNDGIYSIEYSGGSGNGQAVYLERHALGGFPTPPLPRFKDPFSLGHVANALSLLATAFGR